MAILVSKDEKLAVPQPEPKKPYTSPRLTRHGTIGELTKGGGGFSIDETGSSASNSF